MELFGTGERGECEKKGVLMGTVRRNKKLTSEKSVGVLAAKFQLPCAGGQ